MSITRRFDQKIAGDRIELDPRIGYQLLIQVQDPVGVYFHEDNILPSEVIKPGDDYYVLKKRAWLGGLCGKTRLLVEEEKFHGT